MSGTGRPAGTAVDAAGLSLAIVATRWHAEITDSLVRRATTPGTATGPARMGIARLDGPRH